MNYHNGTLALKNNDDYIDSIAGIYIFFKDFIGDDMTETFWEFYRGSKVNRYKHMLDKYPILKELVISGKKFWLPLYVKYEANSGNPDKMS